MTDTLSTIRLQALLSPAFPTGAFSYSHGLESAIVNGMIADPEELAVWLGDLLKSGAGWNDAVLLTAAWRAKSEPDTLAEITELARALNFSSTRFVETTAQGDAFIDAAQAWGDLPTLPKPCPLSVAVGAVAEKLEIELEQVMAAYLHAYVSNQIQAALRLMTLGQQGGVSLLASFEKVILEIAERAADSTLDDLGSNTFIADIASMNHETLESRIFRS